jgi:hypothetical protein
MKKGISGGHERHSGSDPSENFEQPKAQPFDEAAEVVAAARRASLKGFSRFGPLIGLPLSAGEAAEVRHF